MDVFLIIYFIFEKRKSNKSNRKTRRMQGEMKVWKERTLSNYKCIKGNCNGTGLPMCCGKYMYRKVV